MIKRTLIALMILPVVLFLLFMKSPYPTLVLFTIVLTLALNEMYVMFRKKGMLNFRTVGLIFGIVIYAILIFEFKAVMYFYAVALFIMGLFAMLLITRDIDSFPKIINTIAPVFIISTLGSFGILLRQLDNGAWWIFILFTSTMTYDTGAYFVGSTLGKHKLMPKLSPNKTVEGAIGGLVISILFMVTFYFFVFPSDLSSNPHMLMHLAVLAVLMSVVGQGGDISVSVIKRYTQVKDSSNLIPGHGGVLDRIDSLMFNAPALYLYIKYFLV